jgi:hypothetical protein
VVWFKDCLCVPNVQSIQELILKEAHEIAYSIHPGSEKMYQDLKKKFWWYGMKRKITEHVAICDSCQRIKVEHQQSVGLLRPLRIAQWKWDEIEMDFIVGLPHTRAGYDSIWIVVDRLTKSAHFIPIKTSYNSAVLAELYVTEPPKSLGPPTVFLVQRALDNPVGAPKSLDKFGICFSYLSQERFTRHADITSIGVTRMRKQ